jgi:hypothetical protein
MEHDFSEADTMSFLKDLRAVECRRVLGIGTAAAATELLSCRPG